MKYDEHKLTFLLPRDIKEVKLYGETDSTSSEARRYALSGGSSPALFIADTQSGGRGRMGRSFYSPSGAGIYMSLLLPAAETPADVILMTSAAAVAVRRAILRVTGVETGIKWVNDLYLDGRKVCGILCELLTEKNMMIVGVGINLYPSSFPNDISHIAGSVLHERSGEGIREALAAVVVEELMSIRSELSDGSFMEEYKKNSIVLGREIRYIENGISRAGVAVDIDGNGRLYVRDPQGQTRVLSSGEISVRFD